MTKSQQARQAPTLTFLGGAGTVTGSKYLIRAGRRQILLECGLFQGLKDLRLRNWHAPALKAGQLDAVVLSHAHIDHSGYLPRLIRDGFRGTVYCTSGTVELLQIMLPDAAYLQEEEAKFANRQGYSKHKPALPLYTMDDAKAALRLLRRCPYGQPIPIAEGVRAIFRRAGHILGAATVELQLGNPTPIRLAFSGDLGRPQQPILRDPEPVPLADVLLLESTYGDRRHAPQPQRTLVRVIRESVARGGTLLIPAFAVGRTQHLLWLLRDLEATGKIPELPVYVDSPMAIDVSAIYGQQAEDHDAEMAALLKRRDPPLTSRRLRLVRTQEESKALNRLDGPGIIISASGMATGGRILHHLRHRLSDRRTTVLLVGFQAEGTRGRALQDGAKWVRMFGQDVPVKATIEWLDGLSAHADQRELLRWLAGFQHPPKRTYLVHGEPDASTALAKLIRARLGWKVRAAQDGETVRLG